MAHQREHNGPTRGHALASATARVGDKWSLLVVDALMEGPMRFSELQDALPDAAPSILSKRLKALERDGIVLAEAYQQRPPRYAYRLSGTGAELAGALALLARWGSDHGDAEGPAHISCGTPLEPRWFCPTCGVVVDDPLHDDLHHV